MKFDHFFRLWNFIKFKNETFATCAANEALASYVKLLKVHSLYEIEGVISGTMSMVFCMH